jgi:hypothetical protein
MAYPLLASAANAKQEFFGHLNQYSPGSKLILPIGGMTLGFDSTSDFFLLT